MTELQAPAESHASAPGPARVGRRWAAVCGIAALAVGLGVAEIAGVLISPRATPVVAAGDTAIELAPRWGKELAIALFGVRDKLFLVTVVALVAVLLAAVAGLLEARRRRAGSAVIVVVAVALGLAAASRPNADTFAFVPGLLAGVAAIVVLPRLLPRMAGPEPGHADRRALLLGGVFAAAAASGLVGYLLGGRVRGVTSSRQDLALPTAVTPAPSVAADATFDRVSGLTPFRTPNADYYRIDTALVVPSVRAQDWRLRIHGMVEREVEVSLADLTQRGLIEKWVTLACVSNEVGGDLIGNALWLGLPVVELLSEAGPAAGADMVLSRSVDGFTAGTPLEALTDDRGALLAVGMNGEPLPVEHGFPARLVVPGLYGYVSATKWVVELEVTRFADAQAYWTQRGWAERGPILISSRIDRPGRGAVTEADGTVVIAGVAWAQDVGVAGVDVRVDSGDGWGPWRPAELADAGTSSTWRQWRWVWTPSVAGTHRVQSRARNVDGEKQVEAETEPFPAGSTGYHTVEIDLP